MNKVPKFKIKMFESREFEHEIVVEAKDGYVDEWTKKIDRTSSLRGFLSCVLIDKTSAV